jgi:NADH/NAD ratio-sensing transcriptional regulator Rex
MSVRNIHTQTARALFNEGKTEKAVQVLDRMQEVVTHEQFPVSCSLLSSLNEQSIMDAIDIYMLSNEKEKALKLADLFEEESYKAINFFGQRLGGYYISKTDVERNISYLMYMADTLRNRGEVERADSIEKNLQDLIGKIQIL